MIRFLLFCCILVGPFPVAGQEGRSEQHTYAISDDFRSLYRQGEQSLLQNKIHDALKKFKAVLKRYPDFPPALRGMGVCYELTGEYEQAAEFYSRALERNPHFSRAMYFEAGSIFYKCGQYEAALEYFEKFDSLVRLDSRLFTYNGNEERQIEQKYISDLHANIRACYIAKDSVRFWNIRSVKNLGNQINTKGDEYFPFVSHDGMTIFYTSRKDAGSDENLFVSTLKEGQWKTGHNANAFNTRENEGMVTLVRDGRQLYFTACQREQVKGTCDIWSGKVNDAHFQDLRPLEGDLNSDQWESQACISCDGRVLYFASNREGGFGGTDLWKSERKPDGSWNEPVNLGKSINTAGDEEAPFISNDGQVLYFSSNGHIGLGEQDIFMSRLSGEQFWSLPVNLGKPVNSSFRELGFFLSADGKTGFFASDRAGGEGGMDIYQFSLPEALFSEPVTYVEGWVKDSITRLPVEAMVLIAGRTAIATDEDGRFFICVEAGDTLHIETRSPDYHSYRNSFVIPEWDNASFFPLNILLDPLFKLPVFSSVPSQAALPASVKETSEKHLIYNILFEFDEAGLRWNTQMELEKFLKDITGSKPIKKIEIIGYADDAGDSSYNYSLSAQRAQTVGDFLKEKGIQADKVSIEAKGEQINSKPDWENRKVELFVELKD